MSELETALEFIQTVERQNPDKSAYQIANILRGYTRKNYTSRAWSTATGYHQEYSQLLTVTSLNRELGIIRFQ